MDHRLLVVGLLSCLVAGACQAQSAVAKRVLKADGEGLAERVVGGSFEEAGPAETPAAAWSFWEKGYTRDATTARTAKASAKCVSDDAAVEHGAGQTIILNQTDPLPIVAGGWSKAEGVSGSPDSGYSLYLDLIYTDGTPLWGQINAFDTGSHDWQYREVVVVPEKPVKELRTLGLFRGHTGTVWFDDFSVKEVTLPEGAGLFDGVPVSAGAAPGSAAGERFRLNVGGRPVGELDGTTGALVADGAVGGFLLRDVAANSDFLRPTCTVTVEGATTAKLDGACPELGLRLQATLTLEDGMLRVRGEVADLRGEDRAVAVYFVLPGDFRGGELGLDVRHTAPIGEASTYGSFVGIGAGTNGKMSRYPIAPVVKGSEALCLATPLDEPRVSRLAYDAASRELYAAFDLGLSPATAKFPSRATFGFVVYRFDPAWGFRSALAEYYRRFPELFTKRVTKEGIWMPFTDIATVQGAEDFGFMFKEGHNNVAWDDAHGIDSFVYVEPVSQWLALAPEIPRTYDAALAELKRTAATDVHSQATLNSVCYRADGAWQAHVIDAPWCNGAMFVNNPDPDLLADQPDARTQAQWLFGSIEGAFREGQQASIGAWRGYGQGFEPADDVAHSGTQSVRCKSQPGEEHGVVQTLSLGQTEPKDLVARVWSRAEGVTGERSNDYALYVDLVYTDGTPSYGHVAAFDVGTHDWEQAEVVIPAEKPIQTASVNLLLRRQMGGTAWFDDVFVGEVGNDRNLARDESFEPPPTPPEAPVLDGTYLDSFEMAANDQNYRREQWAYTDLPLTFSLNTRRVCSLVIFHSYEFEREIARRMHGDGKLLFANAVLLQYAFPAHLLDVLGVETNWGPGGEYRPESDEVMSFRRALCYQKPYLLLLNTDYKTFRPEWVERYFKRCTFYAIFPSFFSHNAADDPYWQNPALYNRDRPLFKRYIPVIAALNAAGWQPLTHARVEGAESVLVERFGESPAHGLYLTLFNDSREQQEPSLAIDTKALGLGERVTVEDVLGGQEVAATRDGDRLVVRDSLETEDVRVLRLR